MAEEKWMSEEEFEQRQLDTHWAGIATGWEACELWLRNKAGNLFKDGRDADAMMVRSLSAEAGEQGRLARQEQRKYHG